MRARRCDLKEVPGKPHGDEPGAAPHAREVHAADVAVQLLPADDHVDEGRRGAEEAVVDDDDVDGARADARLDEQVVECREDDEVNLAMLRVQ